MVNTRLASLFLFSTLLFSCTKPGDDGSSVDLGYNYYPVQTGATWIYDVDSLVYDDNSGSTTIDTFEYQYREQVSGTFTDITGKTGQYISRSFRKSDSDIWTSANTWTILKTELNVQKVQENTRYVKLVFPLGYNKKWDGNAFNNLGEEEYQAVSFDEAFETKNGRYANTLKVSQLDDENAIEEIVRYEVYARNTGMVYQLSDSLNTQETGTRGYRYRLTLKSFTP